MILLNQMQNLPSVAQKEFEQIYPKPGWVEHDPMEIWASQLSVATEAVSKIGTGAAGSAQLKTVAPRILVGDFDPGFFIRHFIKDMKLASEEAENAGVHLGVLDYVLSMYEDMEAQGKGSLGTQALVQYYQW